MISFNLDYTVNCTFLIGNIFGSEYLFDGRGKLRRLMTAEKPQTYNSDTGN